MKRMNGVLWTLQILLTLLFLFAGVTKFVLPIEQMTQQTGLPGGFIRFIGVCEVLGAIGLVVPALTRIRPGLTPLAAAGLVIIMTGATLVTLGTPMPAAAALFPFVVGCAAGFVAYGRWRLVPLHARPPAVQTT